MRTNSPTLLPIFRSRGQVRLLVRLFVTRSSNMPLTRLAAEIGMAPSRVSAEANRLELAGLIRSRRVGNVRILEPNPDSPFQPEFDALLLKAFGPAKVLAEAFRQLDGIQWAAIFGSWADRYHGIEGPAPADLDVVIVGFPDVGAVRKAARVATRELGRQVNPTIVSPTEWAERGSGFLRTASSGTLVPVEAGTTS